MRNSHEVMTVVASALHMHMGAATTASTSSSGNSGSPGMGFGIGVACLSNSGKMSGRRLGCGVIHSYFVRTALCQHVTAIQSSSRPVKTLIEHGCITQRHYAHVYYCS